MAASLRPWMEQDIHVLLLYPLSLSPAPIAAPNIPPHAHQPHSGLILDPLDTLSPVRSSPSQGLTGQHLHPASPTHKPSWMSHCQLEIIMAKTGHPLQVLPTLLQQVGNSMIFSHSPNSQLHYHLLLLLFSSPFLLENPPHVSRCLQPQLLHALGLVFATSPPSSLSTTELMFLSSCFGYITLVPFIGHQHFHHSQLSHPPSLGMLSLTRRAPRKAIKSRGQH